MLVQHYGKHPRRFSSKQKPKQLPSSSKFSIHEVATAYKRIVRGLPGGLLGSVQLLDTLRDISLHVNQDGRLSGSEAMEVKDRLIALALSCVQSDERFSIICATLGLYSWIGHYTETYGGDPANMNYKNLSRLLGPLLIGNELNANQDRIVVAGEPQPGNETQLSPERIAAELAAGLANTEDGNAIALTLLTHWKGIVRELQRFAVNTAATLRHNLDERRLANAESMFELRSGDAPGQPDVLEEHFVGGNRSKIPRPFKALVSLSKNNVHKPSKFVTRSRNETQNSAVKFDSPVRMHDGTGGTTLVRSVPAATDGHKRRAATYQTALRTRPQTEAVVVPTVPDRPAWPKPHPGLEEPTEAASGPVVPFAPVHIAAGYGQRGAPYANEIEPANQPRPARACETRDRREGYLDNEVPSEDGNSVYQTSSDASSAYGSDGRGERIRYGEGFSVNANTKNEGSQRSNASYSDLPHVVSFEEGNPDFPSVDSH